MRMLQKILPALAAASLVACAIPDDGKSELKGTIRIPGSLLPLVVQPGDAGSDCPAGAKGWGERPAIGDELPTVYVGLYKKPISPLEDNFNPNQDAAWRNGCGDIDEDNNPVTPPVHHEESCPVGGTTAVWVQTVTGTNGGAFFEFEALQLDTGDFYLWAWLDNRCAPDNAPSASLVWDMGGPPGPLDAKGEVEVDENDLTIPSALAVSIGHGGNELDDVLVLSSALGAASL